MKSSQEVIIGAFMLDNYTKKHNSVLQNIDRLFYTLNVLWYTKSQTHEILTFSYSV